MRTRFEVRMAGRAGRALSPVPITTWGRRYAAGWGPAGRLRAVLDLDGSTMSRDGVGFDRVTTRRLVRICAPSHFGFHAVVWPAVDRRGGRNYAQLMNPIRVVIAEDHLLVRAGVQTLLSLEDDLEVVAVCGSYPELKACVDRGSLDVVVTDIRMPPSMTDEGIRAAAELRRSHPDVAVVVLSQFLEPVYLRTLIAQGSQSRGYLLKERVAAQDQLVNAVRAVAAGGSFIDALVVESLVTAEARHSASPLRRLTPREQETLAELATGKSNTAIAAGFRVTERAVEKHVNAIFTKLDLVDDRDVNRRVKAVLMLLSYGSQTR